MRVLIAFDQKINVKLLQKRISRLKSASIVLFPLTPNQKLICDIKGFCQSIGADSVKVEETAKLVDSEVDTLRERLPEWSSVLGKSIVGGKTIRDWFFLPGSGVSAWWFSLLSEKNSLKTDIFFRIAQLQAIDNIILSGAFDLCIFSFVDSLFCSALEKVCNRNSTKGLSIKPFYRRWNLFNQSAKPYFNHVAIFNSAFKGLANLAIYTFRAFRARWIMGPVKSRIPNPKKTILFVSYFPSVDEQAATKGVLKNKYTPWLQDKILKMDKKIIWIWMYNYLYRKNYADAVMLAEKFQRNGEVNFLFYEFLSLKILLRVFFLWLRQTLIFLKVERLTSKDTLCKNLSLPESTFFLKKLMRDSFVGGVGVRGILHLELFKSMFSYFSGIDQCIYYAEMQAWEKALCSAKQIVSPRTKTIAFIHSSVPKNFFPYSHHRSEMDSLPLPDALACNGDVPLKVMKDYGYPRAIKVEAIRYLYLNEYLNRQDFPRKKNVVLLVGWGKKIEDQALISLFYEAFPQPSAFKVWLREHPCLPFKQTLDEVNMDISNRGRIVKDRSLKDLLEAAKVVIVGNSTVALEALMTGCKVITPVFNNSMFMSPLQGFEKYYSKVRNAEELRSAVEESLGNSKIENFLEIKEFILKYWCFDDSLHRWERLLA